MCSSGQSTTRFGLSHLELVPFAAHHLDQDGELELAAPRHAERVRRVGLVDPHRHVRPHFLEEPLPEVPGGDVLPVAPGEGGDVRREQHGDGGLVDADRREGHGAFGIGQGLPDVHRLDAGDRDKLPRTGLGHLDAPEALVHVDDRQLGRLHRASAADDRDAIGGPDGPVRHASDDESPHVVVPVEAGRPQL
jgi:hypothetical protein